MTIAEGKQQIMANTYYQTIRRPSRMTTIVSMGMMLSVSFSSNADFTHLIED
jgi:hypothetical protein